MAQYVASEMTNTTISNVTVMRTTSIATTVITSDRVDLSSTSSVIVIFKFGTVGLAPTVK